MKWRFFLLKIFFILFFTAVIVRLFYWQVLSAEKLRAIAESQYFTTFEIPTHRGNIYSFDRFPLVTNQEAYLLYAYLPELTANPQEISLKLAPILVDVDESIATPSLRLKNEKEQIQTVSQSLLEKLTSPDLAWVPLKRKLSAERREQIERLDFAGLGFETEPTRNYPEASMAAQLLGFVGSDSLGNPQGYFGLEGFYDLELKGRPGLIRQEKDAQGRPIIIGSFQQLEEKDGSQLILHLDRSVQLIAEEELSAGISRYGAISGDIVILDPQNGAVLALAAFPNYDPAAYSQFDSNLYKIPSISDLYEPGSTFKIFVLAAALDSHLLTPQTRCPRCDGPRTISGYQIRTWNNEYHPNLTMNEVIQYSDNIGMVFVAQSLGKEKMLAYLDRFQIGQATDIDLQGEVYSPLRPLKDYKDIDLATNAFGQGIAVTAIQMVKAIGAIANDGKLYQPQLVAQIEANKNIVISPKLVGQPISPATAEMVKNMMVNAVDKGEAKWAKPPGYQIAGKTGTAQIPVAGHYDEEKTIASFIGFAPADHPKFVMLVRLREPTTSPWGSETAAPLWFKIAVRLFDYFGIPPSD